MDETFEPLQKLCPGCGKTTDADARFCKHCAFDLANSNASYQGSTEINQKRSNWNILGVLGALCLLVFVAIGLVMKISTGETKPSVEGNVDSVLLPTDSTLTLSEKAQQIEEKILRGETLAASDLEGLSPEELRILRNVHFARYGRKYEKPGLGDYFYTRPWYKSNENYKDSLLSATDKENIKLFLAAENLTKNPTPTSTNDNSTQITNTFATTVSNTESNQSVKSAESDCSDSLTTACAQKTVERAMEIFKKDMGDSISPNARAIVQGVREIPQQNLAQADIIFLDAVTSCIGQNYRWKIGVAVFKHYTDGRWVMTQIQTDEFMCTGTITFKNLEVK